MLLECKSGQVNSLFGVLDKLSEFVYIAHVYSWAIKIHDPLINIYEM